MALVSADGNVGIGTEEADRFWVWGLSIVIHKRGMELMHGAPGVTPLGLSCWHVSLMYLYSAIYDSCELLMCTTGSLDTHTGHSRNLDT